MQHPGGDVHRHRQQPASVPPGARLVEHEHEHPAGQRLDQVALLGEGDETARLDQPVGRMLPADQRLDRCGPPGTQVHLGLVVQDELTAGDRRTQAAEQLKALPAVLVGVRGVDGDAEGELLRPVHGHVRAAHQRPGITSVSGGERDPDAAVHVQGQGADVDALGQRRPDAARDRQRVGGTPRCRREQDRELVPAEAGDRVAGPGGPAQPYGDLAQHVVAHVVTQRVVDLLEPVEIHQQQREPPAVPLNLPQRPGDPVVQEDPVGQAGQRVVQGLAADLLLGVVPFDRRGQHVGDRLDEVRLVRGKLPWLRRVRHQQPETAAGRSDAGGDTGDPADPAVDLGGARQRHTQGCHAMVDDHRAVRGQYPRDHRAMLRDGSQHLAVRHAQRVAHDLGGLPPQAADRRPDERALAETGNRRLPPFGLPQVRDVLQHHRQQVPGLPDLGDHRHPQRPLPRVPVDHRSGGQAQAQVGVLRLLGPERRRDQPPLAFQGGCAGVRPQQPGQPIQRVTGPQPAVDQTVHDR